MTNADATQQSSPSLTPSLHNERIDQIDVLRGFALSGILFVHVRNFDNGGWEAAIDQVALWFTGLFVVGSFLNSFTFLFGLGYAIQLERANNRGMPFVRLYARRLGVLLIFGLVHSLFMHSDVLTKYAVLGLLLLPFRNCPPKLLITSAFLLNVLQVVFANLSGERQETDWFRPSEWHSVFEHGAFGEVMLANTQIFIFKNFVALGDYARIAPGFLLGFGCGKLGVFQDLKSRMPFVRKVFWATFVFSIIGISGSVVAITHLFTEPKMPVFLEWMPEWQGYWWLIHPALSLCYLSGLLLLLQRPLSRRLLSPLGSYGRMALTNYLGQTAVLVMTVHAFGFGLYGKIGPAGGIVFVLVVVGLQVVFSVCWLRRFRFGPVEWLWRSLTYWKRQPILALSVETSSAEG